MTDQEILEKLEAAFTRLDTVSEDLSTISDVVGEIESEIYMLRSIFKQRTCTHAEWRRTSYTIGTSSHKAEYEEECTSCRLHRVIKHKG